MLGSNIDQVGWPACGEIDIMENIGKEPNTVHGSIHATWNDQSSSVNVTSPGDTFHTYAAQWSADKIEFLVDDKIYHTVYKGGNWPFESGKFFLILNLAVGGYWPGYPDATSKYPQ